MEQLNNNNTNSFLFSIYSLKVRKGKHDDMQVNVAGLRRNIKNLAHNYSDAQVNNEFLTPEYFPKQFCL